MKPTPSHDLSLSSKLDMFQQHYNEVTKEGYDESDVSSYAGYLAKVNNLNVRRSILVREIHKELIKLDDCYPAL